MIIADTVIAAAWAVFLLYWWVSALSANKSRPNPGARGGIILRLLVGVSVLAAIKSRAFDSPATSQWNPHLYTLSTILTVAGIALAIYARWHLGRNWGMPMSEREHPELITSGPYRLIRHPIYTGILTAILGTSLATTWLTLIPFAILAAYFFYSARAEERVMLKEFPEAYPSYRSKSKMLIPFIF